MLNAGLPLSGKAEHSYENFPQPEWCKGRRSYCRVHHDNGCAREMEMKPRCPQMQLRALGCDAEREGAQRATLPRYEKPTASVLVHCEISAGHCFCFSLFRKSQSPLQVALG